MTETAATRNRQKICFSVSLLIAVGYGLLYHRHELGVSPFHISARLPGVDQFILIVTVICPLVVGIVLAALSGKLKWFVLPIYPVVVALSLF